MSAAPWRYAHQNLDEPRLPDGSPIMRPCVTISTGADDAVFLGVVDSGSPITVADAALLTEAGIDLTSDDPVMELPSRSSSASGAGFDTTTIGTDHTLVHRHG